MREAIETLMFQKWIDGLRDVEAQVRIDFRIQRLLAGNAGDARSVGGGVSELRIDYGPGYLVYYTVCGDTLVILLAGGDKRTQSRDIALAIQLAREF